MMAGANKQRNLSHMKSQNQTAIVSQRGSKKKKKQNYTFNIQMPNP
jgi:hypothetical protein